MTPSKAQDIELLSRCLKGDFGHVQVQPDYGWPGKPALCVLDCVLSLNRHYDRVVYPRLCAFLDKHPGVVNLEDLSPLAAKEGERGAFFEEHLHYRDPKREATFWGVVAFLQYEQSEFPGATEWERLQAWASAVHPGDYLIADVRGFGLAGWQYLRMLFGVQTTKPDLHVIRFVSHALGREVTAVQALTLLERAAVKAALPLREVDNAIWAKGARPKAL